MLLEQIESISRARDDSKDVTFTLIGEMVKHGSHAWIVT
jgi:hypothetical protein